MIFNEEKATLFNNKYSKSCIYFLLQNNKVVYVGKTLNGKLRINQHKNEKIFDEIYIIKCKKNELSEIEDYYMMKYKPKYNLLSNNYRKNIITIYNELRKKYFIGIIEFIDFIKDNNIKIEKFNNVESITKTDYLKVTKYFMELNNDKGKK